MRLRRRRGADPGEDPDATFGFLSARQAARVRELVRLSFAELGVEVVINPGHVTATGGVVYGLGNLMATCRHAERGERDWPRLVGEHCRRIHQAMSHREDLSTLTPAEVERRTYLRVYGSSALPKDWRSRFRYARPLAGDLVELLCLDEPQTVRILRDEDVERFGIERLQAAGLENLLRDPIDEITPFDSPDGVRMWVVRGDSVYVCGRVLILPDLLRRVFGERLHPHGVLVAVPDRHEILLHPICGPEAFQALVGLVRVAQVGFTEGVGPVSPFVYWWHEGRLRQVSFVEEDRVVVRVEEELAEILQRLTG